MGILQNKTIEKGLGKMGVFSALSTESRNCETHGEYVASEYKFGWTPCPTCQNEKNKTASEAQQRRQEAEWKKTRMQSIFAQACIPPRFADRTLDGYKAELPGQIRALKICREYVESFSPEVGASLIFVGGVGSGKTHLSVGIANELMGQGRTALFMSVMKAVRSVKETYRRDSSLTEREAIANLIEPDLLILDEVGVQFGSDTEKLILFEIINGRYESRRSTIVISNLAIEPLSEYLGERVIDRLREDGGRLIIFDWPSHRRQS